LQESWMLKHEMQQSFEQVKSFRWYWAAADKGGKFLFGIALLQGCIFPQRTNKDDLQLSGQLHQGAFPIETVYHEPHAFFQACCPGGSPPHQLVSQLEVCLKVPPGVLRKPGGVPLGNKQLGASRQGSGPSLRIGEHPTAASNSAGPGWSPSEDGGAAGPG